MKQLNTFYESLETSSAKPIDREDPFSHDTAFRTTHHRKIHLYFLALTKTYGPRRKTVELGRERLQSLLLLVIP